MFFKLHFCSSSIVHVVHLQEIRHHRTYSQLLWLLLMLLKELSMMVKKPALNFDGL